MATKDELEKQNEELQKQLDEAQAIIEAQKRTREGWLIESPNLAYSGQMFNGQVVFTRGLSFVKRSEIISYFVPELRPDQIQKLSKAEQEALKADYEARSSEKCVKNLESDFGYHCRYFTKDQTAELDAAIADHKTRAKPALEEQARQEKELIKRMNENHPSYP